MSRDKFYEICVQKNIVDTSAKILVLGAGIKDESIFKKLNFKNVTYSNYNSSGQNDKYINNILLQDIKLEDESYDYCVAHACIHHSSKPHNSILEMHRVAKKGILVIEANDCLTTRIACRLNYAEEFEKTAVINNNLSGGVDNLKLKPPKEINKNLSFLKQNLRESDSKIISTVVDIMKSNSIK